MVAGNIRHPVFRSTAMKRRHVLLVAALATMIVLAALAKPTSSKLLVLEWANKAAAETPPVAILIEMGLVEKGEKETKPKDWSGQAKVTGAKIVHREGYRFRKEDKKEDKLTEPDGWEASSHRGLRLPKGPAIAAVAKLEPIATVGVVLHLTDVQNDAALTVEPADKDLAKAVVPLKEVLAGQSKDLWNGAAVVRRISTATPITTGKTEDDFPAAAYGPDGTLWVAYISYTVRDESRRIEQLSMKDQPKNFKSLYTPELADQLFVKYYREGKWSEPIAVTKPKESLARCAIAVEDNGEVWVAYSAFRKGQHHIYARSLKGDLSKKGSLKAGAELQLSTGNGPSLSPVMCTDQKGRVHVAFQSASAQKDLETQIVTIENGKLQGKRHGLKSQANHWSHSLAAAPDGGYAVAYDEYQGDYDVTVDLINKDNDYQSGSPVAATTRFEARPSAVYDNKGRLWIAYEEGPQDWGKDYGALAPNKGNPLYNERSVRVVCFENGKLFKPAAELPTSVVKAPVLPFEPVKTQKFEKATRYAYPRLGLDGKGRLWLTYRQSFGSRYTTHPGSYWMTFARRLDGDQWTAPVEIHHSDGLLDHRPVLLPHKSGGLWVLHNTDGRYTTPETIHNHIYASIVDLPGEPLEPKLVLHDAGKKGKSESVLAEKAAVKKIREYRIEAGGKKYQLLRGEFHRHTEISWDGAPDGSLEDMFRYAIDAASMDWIGNGDHDNGSGREYSWWLIQKYSDAYRINERFTPMFTYERSVAYPHGHRNCMFDKRGVRTLPRLAEEEPKKKVGGVHADDTKMLYRYLKDMGGICASHTSATGMGTDWRDNDPAVEPIVEIYQGDRMSYEREGAPRAGYDPKGDKLPANVGGWKTDGFINLALEKGYRLGFQASSDHWSTHISFFIALAEKNDRKAILDAVKKRHCYGATDNIILDVRSGNHLMGDEFKTNQAPSLEINVIGTAKLAKIDILRDSDVIATLEPEKNAYKTTWTDQKPAAGTHYYYIRVMQGDDEIAWSSPMWINYVK
jgi:hypothetical protein